MWLPTPLYEALPFLYGILAIVTLSVFGPSIALLSAVLFATAGVLVWRLRKIHRRDEDDVLHVV